MDEDQVFADFVSRIRSGDHSAAQELVHQYEPIVRREIRMNMTDTRMGTLFDSVDICQSMWSSFFARMAVGQFDIEDPCQLTHLLVVMAKTKLAFQCRKNRFQKRDVSRVDRSCSGLDHLKDNQPSPLEIASAQELMVMVLRELTDDECEISEMRRAGFAWEEVATRLGGTAQARRMQLDRAADRVTRQLGLEE